MAAVAQYAGQVYVAPGPGVTFTEEATTGNTGRTEYTITDQAKRYWDPATAVTVEKDIGAGYVAVSAADIAIEYCGGVVVFSAALPAGAAVRVSGKYLVYDKAATIQKINGSFTTQLKETTVLTSEDQTFMPTRRGGNGSFKLADIDAYYSDLLGERIVIVHHLSGTYNEHDSSGPRYEMYAKLNDDAVELPEADLISQTIGYVVEKERHYRST
jgi:hypothetical protein